MAGGILGQQYKLQKDKIKKRRKIDMSTSTSTILLGVAGVGRRYKSLFEKLQANNLKIAAAESCTGGLFAGACTSVAGSSAWFECGVITYSNAAKMALLNVSAQSLEQYGAVSAQVAEQMAHGALALGDVQMSLAVTGIAGPAGGSSAKPVGTVFISLASQAKIEVEQHLFTGGRDAIRRQSVIAMFALLERQFMD